MARPKSGLTWPGCKILLLILNSGNMEIRCYYIITIVYFKYQVGCYIECFMRGDIFPHNLQADFDFRWLCCGLTKYWGWRNNWVKINWGEVKVK